MISKEYNDSQIHEPLSSYNETEIIAAIESKYDCKIDDPEVANIKLVQFYKKWKEINKDT